MHNSRPKKSLARHSKNIIKTKKFFNNLYNKKKILKKVEKKAKNITKTLEKVYITVYNRSVYGLEVRVFLFAYKCNENFIFFIILG